MAVAMGAFFLRGRPAKAWSRSLQAAILHRCAVSTPEVTVASRDHDPRAILDAMTEMVVRFQPDGTIIYANMAYARLLGRTPEDLVGTNYALLIHPDDQDRVRAELSSLRPEHPEVTIENRVLLSTGEVRWTQWTSRGFFDGEGQLIDAYAVARDITPRIEVEDKLRESNDRFRFLAEVSAVFASSLDYEETIARVTRQAVPFVADQCSVTLLQPRQILQRISIAHVDAALEQQLREYDEQRNAGELSGAMKQIVDTVLKGESILVPEFSEQDLQQMDLDEEERERLRLQCTCSYLIVPIAARGRTLGGLTFISSRAHSGRHFDEDDRDLARELGRRAGVAIDNARLYRELQEADALKTQFLATLAHELRNPMAALTGAVELLLQENVPRESRQRALQIARRQLQHQARMVDDLLDVSRLTRGRVELRRERISLSPLAEEIADAMRPLAERRDQTLVLRCLPGAEQAQALVDPDRMRQILGNLLDNAIRYSPTKSQLELRLSSEGDNLQLTVADDGPGFPEDVLERVFDLFVQAPNEHVRPSSGLGIGLTIARELARLHGGDMQARNRPGGGAEVTVRVPSIAHAVRHDEKGAGQPAPSHAQRVLVVDDNEDAADILAGLVRMWGHDVRSVYNGREAIEVAEVFRPDLIMMDIGMPEMDGYQTTRELRSRSVGQRARIVAITGYAQPSDVRAAHEAGFDQHLKKPIDGTTLRSVLGEEALQGGRASFPFAPP